MKWGRLLVLLYLATVAFSLLCLLDLASPSPLLPLTVLEGPARFLGSLLAAGTPGPLRAYVTGIAGSPLGLVATLFLGLLGILLTLSALRRALRDRT